MLINEVKGVKSATRDAHFYGLPTTYLQAIFEVLFKPFRQYEIFEH